MASTNPNTALVASTPNVDTFNVNSPTMECHVKSHFDPAQWTMLHKCAWQMIQNAIPDLSEKEREEICDRWIHITRRKGKGKVKTPTLEQIEKLALYAAQLQANRYRVKFGKQMRALIKHRHSKVHHTKGAYSAKDAARPRVVPVTAGDNTRTRGWQQRDKGAVKRALQKVALIEADEQGILPLRNATKAKLQRQVRGDMVQNARPTAEALAANIQAKARAAGRAVEE